MDGDIEEEFKQPVLYCTMEDTYRALVGGNTMIHVACASIIDI